MSQEYIEITEKTVSEAITAACQKLAVPSERLEYEVIDPGKTGFLGIGSRAARIRARIKQGMEESEEFDTSAIINDVLKGKDEKKKSPAQTKKHSSGKSGGKSAGKAAAGTVSAENSSTANSNSVNRNDVYDSAADGPDTGSAPAGSKKEADHAAGRRASAAAKNEGSVRKEDTAETAAADSRKETAAAERAAAERAAAESGSAERGKASEKSFDRGTRERSRNHRNRSRRYDREDRERKFEQERPVQKKKNTAPALTDEQIEEVRNRAEVFLKDVFEAMDLDAEISSVYDRNAGILTIDMKGENMGMLIGKRGQTLDSLQYLVSLVVNKGIEGYIHVKADTENYRERRKKTLENLAKNIASKVKRNRVSVALEPMNPYERRIIHSALQGDRYVTTYSEGEEPYRKVIVTMKEDR